MVPVTLCQEKHVKNSIGRGSVIVPRDHVCALWATKQTMAVGIHFYRLCEQQRPVLLFWVSLPLTILPPKAPSSVKPTSDGMSCLKLCRVS